MAVNIALLPTAYMEPCGKGTHAWFPSHLQMKRTVSRLAFTGCQANRLAGVGAVLTPNARHSTAKVSPEVIRLAAMCPLPAVPRKSEAPTAP